MKSKNQIQAEKLLKQYKLTVGRMYLTKDQETYKELNNKIKEIEKQFLNMFE